MRLDDVLDVIIRETQQNGERAFHSAESRIHEGEVVVARPTAVALLDARPVILRKRDAEGLLHLAHLGISKLAATVFPRDVLPAHLLKPEGEAAGVADRLVYRCRDQLHAARLLMMVPSQTRNLLLVAVNGSKLLSGESGGRYLTPLYGIRERARSFLEVQGAALDSRHGALELRIERGDVIEDRESTLIEDNA